MADLTRFIGFPTGCVEGKTALEALEIYREAGIENPEIHALSNDDPILAAGRAFPNASIHLPAYHHTTEDDALTVAAAALERGYTRLVAHPNLMKHPERWRALGEAVAFENLDCRMQGYRSAADLSPIFQLVPEARFCLDVGHTGSWDEGEAANLIEAFAERLVCIHYSEVDKTTGSHFSTISNEVIQNHTKYLKRLHGQVPMVLEMGTTSEENLLEHRRRVADSLAFLIPAGATKDH